MKQLRDKLRQNQQRQTNRGIIGAQDVLDGAKNYNQNDSDMENWKIERDENGSRILGAAQALIDERISIPTKLPQSTGLKGKRKSTTEQQKSAIKKVQKLEMARISK